MKKAASLWLDSDLSSLQVHASTLFAGIPVDNLGLSGALKCASVKPTPSGCTGEFMADLSVATTGIKLRDAHLRRYLRTQQLPFVVVQLGKVDWKQVTGRAPIQADVEVAGRNAPYDVHVKCEPIEGGLDCALSELEIKLSRHGLQPYGYLGAVVDDAVKIKGTLALRRKAS